MGVLEVYEKPSDVDPAKFIRIKVAMDVDHALMNGIQIKFEDEGLRLPFTYESLPMIFYCCGKFGHFFKGFHS